MACKLHSIVTDKEAEIVKLVLIKVELVNMTLAVTGVEYNEASLICTDDWVTNVSNGVVDVALDTLQERMTWCWEHTNSATSE